MWKTFEKFVFDKVYGYFTNNDRFSNGHYGFRISHSVDKASLKMVIRISQYLDDGKLPITVCLDLPKAFGMINHETIKKNILCSWVFGRAIQMIEKLLE